MVLKVCLISKCGTCIVKLWDKNKFYHGEIYRFEEDMEIFRIEYDDYSDFIKIQLNNHFILQ